MKYLISCDVCSVGPSLLIKSNKTLRSGLGGMLSIIIFSVIVFFSWYLGADLVQKKNPAVLQKIDKSKPSVHHQMNRSNFFMGFWLEDENNNPIPLSNNSAQLNITWNRYIASTADTITVTLGLSNCSGYDYLNYYSEFELESYTCATDFDFDIGGEWSEDTLNYIGVAFFFLFKYN